MLNMSEKYTTTILKELLRESVIENFLDIEEQENLFKLIQEKDVPLEHTELALEILTTSPKNCTKILTEFTTYPKQTQAHAALILASFQEHTIQYALFELLQNIKDDDIIDTLTFCMAKSPYLNIAPILDNLYTEDSNYKKKLIELIRLTPLEKFEIFIAATPELPHEAIFRRIYGHEAINKLRGQATN